MNKITALTRGKKRENRVNVFLDGKFRFSLPEETAVTAGLRIDQELSPEQLSRLARAADYHRCLAAAQRYLSYRPRSESELTSRLQHRGFGEETIQQVTQRLKTLGLVDDAAFARFWTENREAFSPRSRWLLKAELQRKGLAAGIITTETTDIDEGESAYRAALGKARRLSGQDYADFRLRLASFLRRRGFGYEVIQTVVPRVWQEYQENNINA
ncbi:MAG: RecX family transcriptional regulator [Chloroflexota bacterium]